MDDELKDCHLFLWTFMHSVLTEPNDGVKFASLHQQIETIKRSIDLAAIQTSPQDYHLFMDIVKAHLRALHRTVECFEVLAEQDPKALTAQSD